MTENRNIKPGMTKQKDLLHIPADEILSVFAKNMREKRKQQGITQEKLAEMCCVSVDTVKRYEAGTTNINLVTAFYIAAALGLSLDRLLPGKHDKLSASLNDPEILSLIIELLNRLQKIM